MKPLVSVIVPIYNAASYLQETLDSILASTYRPIEVIMMDDGSTDNSLSIAKNYCQLHSECQIYTQQNAGASAARNSAIRLSHGKYILPVDADNKIAPQYIAEAVEVLDTNPDIKIVSCRAEFFGERTGEWKFPPFSKQLLARKNMIDTCAMYRRIDWDKTSGYMEDCGAREDWDMWLSLLESGGNFYRLPNIRLYYRVQKTSKRVKDRALKKELVNQINRRHPAYIQKHLGGPLHYHRSWSRFINFFRSEKIVGNFSEWEEGDVIYAKRNTLRAYNGFIIKQFATPKLWRGIIYGWFCKSKAQRSYEYAHHLDGLTPTPMAYREVRYCGILRESWYVCQESDCKYTFNELINNPRFPQRDKILEAIGKFTAALHKHGIFHSDYSGGNILFNDDGSKIQIIDLNRIHFYKSVSIKKGLKNFERLNIDRNALSIIGTAYAQSMNIDTQYAIDYIIAHRWKKHMKENITNL